MFVVDSQAIHTGIDASGRVIEPNNFGAVVARVKSGRYPFAVTTSVDGHALLVGNVGIFQYTHLRPINPTGDLNRDYPLGYPGTGYPDDVESAKTIRRPRPCTRSISATPSLRRRGAR